MKQCKKCQQSKELTEFYDDAKNKDKKKLVCKQCLKEHQHKVRAGEHIQKSRQNSNIYNPRSVEFDIYNHFFNLGIRLYPEQLANIKEELAESTWDDSFFDTFDRLEKKYGCDYDKWQVDELEVFRQEREIQMMSKDKKRGGIKNKNWIEQIDLIGDVLATFPSPKDASFHICRNNKGVSSICNCAGGRTKTAYGFIWRYLE